MNGGTYQGVVTSDRTCMGCGYQLRGLSLGGQCPECGTPIRSLKSIDDPLSAMPTEMVRAVRNACWFSAACAAVIVGMLMSRVFVAWLPSAYAAVCVAMAVFWAISVWVPTGGLQGPQAAWHGLSERHRLRAVTRALAWTWVPYAAARWLIEAWLTMPVAVEQTLDLLLIVTGMAGVASVVMFAIVMQRLAGWLRDDTAERAFIAAMWLVPIAAMILKADITFRYRLEVVLQVIALIGVGALPYGMLSMARSLHYAVIHAETDEDREERRAERRRRDDERVARAIRRMDQSGS